MEKPSNSEATSKNKSEPTTRNRALDEPREWLELGSSITRFVILAWSGTILTLAYVKLPAKWGVPEQGFDPTFVASIFTATLATFGVQASRKKNDQQLTRDDIERLIEAASRKAPHQTIRIEQAPLKFVTAEDEPPVLPPT